VSPFDRLHPALQHHIVNSLGWRSLRPLQEAAIAPLLAGEHALLLAPTAGGKTEAALFPLLSRMLAEDWRRLSVLYLCPMKALLNNLEARLIRYGELLGRRVAVWHGDVADGARRRIAAEPPDILLATPESLEVMLVSGRIEHRAFFADLRAVVVDEVHAFAGDDRGWHLLALIERLQHLARGRFQRLGLSATVGNPEALLAWLVAGHQGPRRVLAPEAAGAAEVEVGLDYVGSIANAALVLSRLHRGEKRLVFCDSRSRVEELAVELRARGTRTYVSHSSLSAAERRRAEAAFAAGGDCVIVATSTLELGVDVGDLDRVIQIDAPATVAGFLQRLGRTGRRPGSRRNCLFLATSEQALLRAAALLRLWAQGYVEPIEPPPLPYHIVAQQVMALSLQEGGIGRETWPEWIAGMLATAGITAGKCRALLDHMLANGLLHDDEGILGIGRKGEAQYGRRHFMELFSVFTAPPTYTVLHGREPLGTVQRPCLLAPGGAGALFTLGGRSWKVTAIDEARHLAYVEPSSERGSTRWLGAGAPMHYRLARAIAELLAGDDTPPGASRRARHALAEARERYPFAATDHTTLEVRPDGVVRWWTFAGTVLNRVLAERLRGMGIHAAPDDLALLLDDVEPAALGEIATRLLRAVDGEEAPPPPEADAKFAECLPPSLRAELATQRIASARHYLPLPEAVIWNVVG